MTTLLVACNNSSSSSSSSDDSDFTPCEECEIDNGLPSAPDPEQPPEIPPIYDLSVENYTVEKIWSATGHASKNNFNGKNYHSMSVWRDGYTYIIYVDDEYRARIVKISDDASEITTQVVADYSILADGHHAMSIGMDRTGYLHVSGDMHNYPAANTSHLPEEYQDGKIMYWRSLKPFDITAFEWLGNGEDGKMPYGDGFSYMSFMNDINGELYFSARTRTKYHPNYGNKHVFTVNRYDSTNKIWHAIGPSSSVRRDAVTLLGNDVELGTGSYTRIHGSLHFDSANRMYMAANVIEGDVTDPLTGHYATHGLLLISDDRGETAMRMDGSKVIMPGHAEEEHSQQADINYLSQEGRLSTSANVVTDRFNRPYLLQNVDGVHLVGWRVGKGWVDFDDLDGILTGGRGSGIFKDQGGVITVFDKVSMYRFFEPGAQIIKTNLDSSNWSNVDRTYHLFKRGFQTVSYSGDEITLLRLKIEGPTQ